MPYMLLIIEPSGQRRSRPESEGRERYDAMLKFSRQLQERGLLTVSQSLKDDTAAARVQVRGTGPTVVDGPFAEAREMIGGFFLLTCASLQEAIKIAAECPAAAWATVEVRELGPCFE